MQDTDYKRKVRLFIAMSLDGYIADESGGVNWLSGHGKDDENIDTYSDFIKDINTIVMGWNTYHQIVTELSPDEWVYQDCMTYVVTHHKVANTDKIRFTDTNPVELIKMLQKENSSKDIWICGGANLIGQLINEDMIDCYYITVVPTILGSGIRLFSNTNKEIKLKLVRTQSYNGMTGLIYIRR